MAGLAILLVLLPGIRSQPDPAEAVLKLLVFGCHAAEVSPLAERDPDVTARLRSVENRCGTFAQHRPEPAAGSLDGMVALARWGYEQRLFAIADGDAEAEATRYVAALRPCYEWEGFHDCPEREAVFADRYLTGHPSSAFAPYLPLLAAHRWLCAAEAYEHEMTSGVPAPKPDAGHTRARLSYVQRLEAAARSRDPLVRAAAEILKDRGACF